MHQNRSHHHHGTAEGPFTAKKWFGHRAGRSPCAHSIGKFFLCYIVFFLKLPPPARPGTTCRTNYSVPPLYGNPLRGKRGLKGNELIAGGWRGGFEAWCGDWKERSLSGGAISQLCCAITLLLEYTYFNFSETAPWTRTLRNHQSYLHETPQHQLSPWLGVPGFDISRVRWDIAHTVLVGTGKDIAGGFLLDLAVHPNMEFLNFLFSTLKVEKHPT